MALNLEQKKAIVAEVAEVASKAHSAVAAEYRGLTVGALTLLRREARKNGVYLRVVKNTLARRAVEGTDFACMQAGLTGPHARSAGGGGHGLRLHAGGSYRSAHPRVLAG